MTDTGGMGRKAPGGEGSERVTDCIKEAETSQHQQDRFYGSQQKILIDNLQRIGHVAPEEVLPPITGAIWGYRRKARLGVRLVTKKGKVLVGFREAASRYLADLSHCEVLVPEVGPKLDLFITLSVGFSLFFMNGLIIRMNPKYLFN